MPHSVACSGYRVSEKRPMSAIGADVVEIAILRPISISSIPRKSTYGCNCCNNNIDVQSQNESVEVHLFKLRKDNELKPDILR